MTITTEREVVCDPYDVDIAADPCPVVRRRRAEAPVYRFVTRRDVGQHLTFGYGIHFGLGAALARLKGRVMLDEVRHRFPEWDVDKDNAGLAPTSTVRGWETLPVVIP
jgi:cytochrome P450